VSQYQPPYQPPNLPSQPDFYYGAYADPLAPARRAAIVMFIIGALGMMCGMFIAVGGSIISPEQLAASPQAQQLQEMEAQSGLSLHALAVLMGVLILLPGILYAALGLWVRRGSAASAVVGIALAGLTSLFLLANLISVILGGDTASMVLGSCAIVIPTALCFLLVVWLIQAFRAAPNVTALRMQYQAQYWQSQQLQQDYGATGYGYGAPQPPPPPQAPEQRADSQLPPPV
jgi:hypothetical protein